MPLVRFFFLSSGGGFTQTEPLEQVRAAPPQKVWFLHRFSLKDLSRFGMESGMVFEGTTGVNNKLTFKLQRTANESVPQNAKI